MYGSSETLLSVNCDAENGNDHLAADVSRLKDSRMGLWYLL